MTPRPLSLTIMRHAEAQKNIDGVHGGGVQDLTDRGIEQARRAGQVWLERTCGDGLLRIFAQPEERCVQTASVVSRLAGCPHTVSRELAGVRLGPTAGLSEADLERAYPALAAELRSWRSGERTSPPFMPGSEGLQRFSARIDRALRGLLDQVIDSREILIVCSTSTANMVRHLLTTGGQLQADAYSFAPISLAGLERFDLDIDSTSYGRAQPRR